MSKDRTLNKKYHYDLISVSHFFYPTKGGLENMAYKLLNDLGEKGHKIIAVHGGANKARTYNHNQYTIKSFKTLNIFKNTYPIFGLRFFKYIYKLINNNPNAKILIHSRHLTSSFLTAFACSLSGKQYFLIEHTAQTSFVKGFLAKKIISFYEKTLSKFVITRAKKIISVSLASRNYILEEYKVPAKKIRVTYNGFEAKELEEFKKLKKERKIVFAGKLLKVKNPEIVHKAFVELAPKHPDWKFYFIGDGNFFKPKVTEHKNLKIINKMIPRKKLLTLFGKSSIYVNSSLSEGLSLTIIEATYLKNIPVLSDAESNVEIAKKLGTKKFTFHKKDENELKGKIELAIKEFKNNELLSKIQEKTKANFKNCNLFKQYDDLLFPKQKPNFKKLTIIIPAHNEEKTVYDVIEKIANLKIKLKKEIIVIDDASKDDTRYIIEQYAKNSLGLSCEYKTIINSTNLGKTQSVRKALNYSTGDLVVIQDADLEYNPENLVTFVKTFVNKPHIDLIYGNRFHKPNEEMIYKSYYFGNRTLSKISNFFTIPRGLKVNDMEVCYKMAKGDLFRKIGKEIQSESPFGLEPELTAKFARERVNYWEIPIDYKPRSILEGKKIKIFRDGSNALYEILRFNFFKS